MAKININAEVHGPDQIKINLVREDYLETSNNYRIFFEVCLGIAGALLGSIISLVNESKPVPSLNWIFLAVMIAGCIVFLRLSIKHFRLAKSEA